MRNISATGKEFLDMLERWLQSQPEVLVLIRFSRAAGKKSFELFSSFAALSERLRQLPPSANIIAFKQPQLPLRGVVDDAFIGSCLSSISDGSEFVVVETVPRMAGHHFWFHESTGESHTELRETLEDLRGSLVAVGVYPPWLQESPDVISAVVPDEHGVVTYGVY